MPIERPPSGKKGNVVELFQQAQPEPEPYNFVPIRVKPERYLLLRVPVFENDTQAQTNAIEHIVHTSLALRQNLHAGISCYDSIRYEIAACNYRTQYVMSAEMAASALATSDPATVSQHTDDALRARSLALRAKRSARLAKSRALRAVERLWKKEIARREALGLLKKPTG